MRALLLSLFLCCGFAVTAQEERDTVLSRCPVYILDTVSNYNYFITARPATIRVYRAKGDLTVVVEQRDQFFTLFFNGKRLRETTYKISAYPRANNEMVIRYSFKTDGQVSYVDMSSGVVEVTRDDATAIWKVKVTGIIANFVGSTVSNFKVTADLPLK